jgi:hypothetical protein
LSLPPPSTLTYEIIKHFYPQQDDTCIELLDFLE